MIAIGKPAEACACFLFEGWPMSNSEVSFKGPDVTLAYLLLRVLIGMNIMMHGLARLLSGESKFVASLVQMYQGSLLPLPLVTGFATVLPWIEATIGFLILTGLKTRMALAAGGFLMIVLTFGVTVRQNWETAGSQLLYGLVFALLLASAAANRYSLDSWLLGRKA
jgi:thiosulfate dehydrogenase [quinone] large subunit